MREVRRNRAHSAGRSAYDRVFVLDNETRANSRGGKGVDTLQSRADEGALNRRIGNNSWVGRAQLQVVDQAEIALSGAFEDNEAADLQVLGVVAIQANGQSGAEAAFGYHAEHVVTAT